MPPVLETSRLKKAIVETAEKSSWASASSTCEVVTKAMTSPFRPFAAKPNFAGSWGGPPDADDADDGEGDDGGADAEGDDGGADGAASTAGGVEVAGSAAATDGGAVRGPDG